MAHHRPAVLAAVVLMAALPGCALFERAGVGSALGLGGRQSIEGASYRTRLATLSAPPRALQVTVSPAAANPAGAREAGRFEAVQHCFFNYGSSEILWTLSPDDPALPVAGNALVLQGACKGL